MMMFHRKCKHLTPYRTSQSRHIYHFLHIFQRKQEYFFHNLDYILYQLNGRQLIVLQNNFDMSIEYSVLILYLSYIMLCFLDKKNTWYKHDQNKFCHFHQRLRGYLLPYHNLVVRNLSSDVLDKFPFQELRPLLNENISSTVPNHYFQNSSFNIRKNLKFQCNRITTQWNAMEFQILWWDFEL